METFITAQCLQWKAVNAKLHEEADGCLVWAEVEAKGAMAMFRTFYGENSLKVAQTYSLLGQIYTKMEK